jgi:hypothetical protein
MTDEDAATASLARVGDREHIRVERVKYSLRQLTAARDQISAAVNEGADSIYITYVDEVRNAVVLRERTWVKDEMLAGTRREAGTTEDSSAQQRAA